MIINDPEAFACLMLRSILLLFMLYFNLVKRVEKSPISSRLKLENTQETFQTYNNVSHTQSTAKANFEIIM